MFRKIPPDFKIRFAAKNRSRRDGIMEWVGEMIIGGRIDYRGPIPPNRRAGPLPEGIIPPRDEA